MRILCRAYDLNERDGSGVALSAIVERLRASGDEVWATDAPVDLAEVREWSPDIIIGQQWATPEASRWSTQLRRPFVMLVHGPQQYEQFRPQCDLVVFNTESQLALAHEAVGSTPAIVLDELTAFRERLLEIVSAGRRRPTVTLCMTVAHEAATLERAIDSVAAVVDEIVIGVDTRSTDETLVIARRRATRVFEYDESRPPDFPRMRNRAMALVQTDWALVVDGHEWIEHAELIPGALETDAWSIEIQTLYEPDEHRVPGLAFPFPRIHRRHVRFAGAPAHEEVDAPFERRETRTDIHVWHERKPGTAADARGADKRGAELDHLRTAWEQGGDRRALFYLANGLRESGRYGEAIAAYGEYLHAPNFAEEGWQAQLYLARCHAAMRNWEAAVSAFEAAIVTAPERAEAIVGLAYVLLEARDVRRATAWFRMAAALPQPRDCRLFVEVPVYRWGAWHGLALALHAAGDHDGAADAELRAAERGAGSWAHENVAWWRARAGSTVR